MDNTTKSLLGVIVLILVVWGGYTLFSAQETTAPTDTPAENNTPESTDPIKVGLSLPLTGEAASYGDAMLGGAELAIKEINDGGGVNGRLLELVLEDDQCGPSGAESYNKLVNIDKVHVIVGPLCSAAAGPALPIAQEAKIPTLVLGSAPALTATGDYVFRNYPSDSFQGKFAAEYIYNTLGKRKASVIYVKNDWGQGLHDVFSARFEELGGEVVHAESVLQDATDLRTQLTKAKSAEPDVLYVPLYPQGGVAGLKQIKEIGLDVTVVGGDAFDTNEISDLEAANGVIYTIAKTDLPEGFKNNVKEVSGKDANTFSPFVYDAINIFAKVMREVGTDQAAIRDALVTVSHKGIAVPMIEFDQQGDLKAVDFSVKIINDGEVNDYVAE